MVTSSAAPDNGRRTGSGWTLETADREPFFTEVERRDDVTIVRPSGDLDLATAGPLHSVLNGIEHAEQLVLDLRGLSFIDSTGLRLLVALHKRSQRDGFQLTLVAPAAPVDKAIQLCGLDETLPFVEVVEPVQSEPAGSASAAQGGT